MLEWLDFYSAGWTMLIVGIAECLAIGWIYGRGGIKRVHLFYLDVKVMLGSLPCLFWRVCWQVVTPVLILV